MGHIYSIIALLCNTLIQYQYFAYYKARHLRKVAQKRIFRSDSSQIQIDLKEESFDIPLELFFRDSSLLDYNRLSIDFYDFTYVDIILMGGEISPEQVFLLGQIGI